MTRLRIALTDPQRFTWHPDLRCPAFNAGLRRHLARMLAFTVALSVALAGIIAAASAWPVAYAALMGWWLAAWRWEQQAAHGVHLITEHGRRRGCAGHHPALNDRRGEDVA